MEASGLSKKKSLKELLEENSLGTSSALAVVAEVAHNGESDAIRLRAAEMALKMSGDLETEVTKAIPIVNIIIRDTQNVSVNPILIPRGTVS